MKKKYFSLLIILSLLFSGNTMVQAEEEIIEELITIEETSTATPAEIVTEENISELILDLPTTEATLRIETLSGGEILRETITVTACKPYETSEEYTLNAKCLIDQVGELTTTWNYFGTDAFLDSVNGISNNFGENLFWGYFINLEYASVALNAYTLAEGDEILLVYGVNPLKIETDSMNPILNTTTTVQVYEFGLDEFWNPVWIPSNGSTILINGVEYSTSENGITQVRFTDHGSHTIQALKKGFAQSNTITLQTTLPTIKAALYAVANGTILFQDTVEVTACKPYEASEEYTLNAKCLIDQAVGLTSTWNFFGTDAFLDSVNSISNDFGANNFWGYFINLEYGSVALNADTLAEGDEILIQYNTTPLKLELSTTSPMVGDSVTLSISEFGLDEFWNPIWLPSTSSTITINEETQFIPDSTVSLPITTTSPYTIRVEKNGYTTQEITFTAAEAPTPTTPPSSGNNSGGSSSNSQNNSGAQSIINFLDTKQNTDGSFGTTAFLSDWAAIAYGAWASNSLGESKLTSYLLTNPSPLDGPNKTTNYARRAMALMALDVNPYTGTQTNYINEIIKGFDGTQFGEVGLINDDIFALVPLLRSGYSSNDAIIVSTTKYIIANQDTHGSFGSVDLTGAAIQTLSELSSIEGVTEALTKAKNYLILAQQTDGGFGNVYATGWVMQGITALGENATTWNKNGNTPVTYIQNKQASDGGMLVGDTNANRIWASSYALPGILNKPWHTILSSFNKPNSETGSTSSGDTTGSTTSTTVATTTPIIVTTPTSTPTSTTTDVVLEEPALYTYTEVTEQNFQTPTYNEPVRTAVLGEKEKNIEVISKPLVEENIKNTVTTTVYESESENPQTKKYIFITSLIIFLGLIGYSIISRRTSKK